MSIDKVDNNIYRFNGYSNYPQISTPTMRVVDNHVQPQTNNTQYSNLSPLSNDTVSISASDQIKGSNSKKGMSTLTKVGLTVLGIGATAYACLVGHRMMTKPNIEKIAQNFSDTFRREVSPTEAKQLTERYKEIYQIKDTEQFVKTLFEQIKKDYGFEKANIPLKLSYYEKGISLKECMGARKAGGMNSYDCTMQVEIPCLKGQSIGNNTKRKIANTMFHEFRHTQQQYICYSTDKSAFFKALETNHLKDSGNIDKEIQKYKSLLQDQSELKKYAKQFNKTVDEMKAGTEQMIEILEKRDDNAKMLAGINSFNKEEVMTNYSKAYDKMPTTNYKLNDNDVKSYLENFADYKDGSSSYDEYRKQALEFDAHDIGDKAQALFDSFASVWRLPYLM